MVAAVAGDIDKSEAVKGINRLLQALPKEKAPERRLHVPDETPPVLALIHKPGQVQSQVAMSLSSVMRTHPAYWKMSLLMDVFGGSGSLMYTRLRDDLGLIYAGGFFQIYKWKAGILVGYIGCKGDATGQAIKETVNIMHALRKDVPPKALEQKRLDALNSFVFNVDTPGQLVKTYATYHMREEPLDTLERIQDAFMGAERNELEVLARKFVDPKKLQIFVAGDKMTTVKKKDGKEVTLEQDLKALAKELNLPYEEIALR
jgi:predicted Zn-dependent peptidase